MDHIYVFGHKNPDSDSICSAIAYTELKKKLGFTDIAAYRLGNINNETQFILDYFEIEKPPLLKDVKIALKDLSLYMPIVLSQTDPLKLAWDSLNESNGSRLIPVLDHKDFLEGIVSLGDITKIFMESITTDSHLVYEILFENLLDILEAEIVYGKYKYKKIEGNLYIGSSAIDTNTEITEKDVIITAKLETAKKYALELKCGCVILVNGDEPLGLENSEAAIVSVNKNLYKTILLINQAISIGSIMHKKNIITLSSDNHVEDIIDITKSSQHRNFPVVDRQGHFVGVLSRRHLLEFKQKQVILIDHNERNQSVDGLENANILEIIDHHRVADIQTGSPLYIRSEPVGCSATIVFKMYNENRVKVSEKMAGLMLSAIISDTLMFMSPTCTNEDKAAVERLAIIAGVNVEEYGRELFTASTSLEGFTAEEILGIDMKKFSFGKYLAVISQVNTMDFKSIVNKREELISAMKSYYERHNCDLVILMITNIIEGGSEIIAEGNKAKELVVKAFNMKREENSIFLPGVVSRKKQMVPKLTVASQTI